MGHKHVPTSPASRDRRDTNLALKGKLILIFLCICGWLKQEIVHTPAGSSLHLSAGANDMQPAAVSVSNASLCIHISQSLLLRLGSSTTLQSSSPQAAGFWLSKAPALFHITLSTSARGTQHCPLPWGPQLQAQVSRDVLGRGLSQHKRWVDSSRPTRERALVIPGVWRASAHWRPSVLYSSLL